MLKSNFLHLLSKYCIDENLIEKLWAEIEVNYSNNKRHYHTLLHLENLFIELSTIKSNIKNWDSVLFALYYHDIIYNPLKSNNEEKSAELAVNRMLQISVTDAEIRHSKNLIVATKLHIKSNDSDINYFLDADLSVLGQSWEGYSVYYKNVRKEFSIYPNFIYNNGRKKVITHFLGSDTIFKTNHFYNKYEIKARENLQKEFDLLS